MPYETRSGRAECQARGHLSSSIQATRDEQAGEIGACNQQETAHTDEKQPGQLRIDATYAVDCRQLHHAPTARLRQSRVELTGEEPHLSIGTRTSLAGLQSAEQHEPNALCVAGTVKHRGGDPCVDLRIAKAQGAEPLRRNPDHHERNAIQLDGLSDDRRSATESSPPVLVPEHDDRFFTRCCILLREEEPAKRRLDSQHLKEVASDDGAIDFSSVVTISHVDL